MRAYSVLGPWPFAILNGDCRLVNVERRLDFTGDVVFRASKRFDKKNAYVVARSLRAGGFPEPSMVPSTHPSDVLFMVAKIVGCWPAEDVRALAGKPNAPRNIGRLVTWAVGPFCVLLDNVRPIATPVPWQHGAIDFFHVPDDVVQAALAA